MVIEREVLMPLIMVDLSMSPYRSVRFDYVMSRLFLLIFFDLKLIWSDIHITRLLSF